LPPDAGAPPQGARTGSGQGHTSRATTQAGTDGPRIAHGATPNFTPPAYALPPPPGGSAYVPGIPAPGYANLPPIPGSAAKGRRRLSVWLLIGLSVVAIAIVGGAIAMGEFEDTKPRPTATTTPPAPSTAVNQPTALPTGAAPTALPPIGAPVQPTPSPVPPSPSTKAPAKPRPIADAATPADDAASFPGFPGLPGIPPFSIPSTLPSIPIQLPSGFPPFTLPGMPGAPTPAPTSSH
jgi:hypothetical protein